jgi:hypothetical protein
MSALALPGTPLLPWIALLLLLARTVLLPSSLPAGAGALIAALVLGILADRGYQRQLRLTGWPVQPRTMRLGYWLIGAGSAAGTLLGAEGLPLGLAMGLKSGQYFLLLPGMVMAVAGQQAWRDSLDPMRAAVVEAERRRYLRLIGWLLLAAVAAGVVMARLRD